MVMLKVLTQYQEVSGDPRVIPVMQKYFRYELRELPNRPLRDWGKYRWQDNVYSVLWLYNRTGDQDLLKLAKLLHAQGYDWEAQFANFKYTSKQTSEKLGLGAHKLPPDAAMQTHGVNNAMALKVAPIWWLVSADSRDRKNFGHQLAMLDKYHGLPNGMFSGDEHFAGTDPSQGIELCAVVEAMFSFEQAFADLGRSPDRRPSRKSKLITLCPALFQTTCGRINMINSPTRSLVREPTGNGRRMARIQTYSAWSPTSVAALQIFTRGGPSLFRVFGWPLRTEVSSRPPTHRAEFKSNWPVPMSQ